MEAGAPVRADPNQRCDGDPSHDGGSEGKGDGGSAQPVNPDTNTYKSLDQGGGPEDCDVYWELRAHQNQLEYDKTPFKVNAQLGNNGNQYYCFYFKPPYDAGDQALWFAPLIDKSKILHHWLLYGTDSLPFPSGSSAPRSAAEPGAYLLAGWAPGAGEAEMPPDVGLQMPTGPVGGLILELHYFNQTDEPFEDSTGVKFCTTKPGKRPHDAAVHFTGGENICLPPSQRSTVRGDCYPTYNGQDIHILNVWPHMHTLGRHMELNIIRANGTREVLHNGGALALSNSDMVSKEVPSMTTGLVLQAARMNKRRRRCGTTPVSRVTQTTSTAFVGLLRNTLSALDPSGHSSHFLRQW